MDIKYLESLKEKEYTLSLKAPNSESQPTDILGDDGIIKTNSPSHCTGCLSEDGTLNLIITIELDDNSETLEFKPKN